MQFMEVWKLEGIPMRIRNDSKSIALLAIFTAMIVAMEAVSIPFITDIRVAGNFTLDWTGIVIFLVFLGLGSAFAIISVSVMWVSIAYRSIPSATFKGVAEVLTLVGLFIAQRISRRLGLGKARQFMAYLILGCAFRGIGMYFGNIVMLPFFLGFPVEAAVATSLVYLPWNLVQAVINVIGGWVIFEIIPEDLAVQAELGEYHNMQKTEELISLEDEDGLDIE